jgi:GTPase SAR1 family protein
MIPPLVSIPTTQLDVLLSKTSHYNSSLEDAYKKEYTITDQGVEKNIVVEIIDTAGQEEFASGLHDKVKILQIFQISTSWLRGEMVC